MKNKTVVITGGGQGIGRIIARDLLKEGYHVAVIEIDREAGLETVREFDLPGQYIFIQTDIRDEGQVTNAIQQTVEDFGSIDYLINNAAISIKKPLEQISLEEWQMVISTNLTGAFLCVKHSLSYLKRSRGAIINLCSTRAFMSEPDTEAYSASKGGIYALTHAMAISLGPDVRVNAISPGWIDVTPHQKKQNRKESNLSETDHSQHPAGRVGQPEDISSMVQFLLREENNFITAQNFIIDGGMTRKMIYH
ncbi:MAG: SDR family oxidoreductase [Cyclobacteriaceae bacterium]|nr:SDR family oxidoreductase [Cyclobacteriaceae bacterium]